ncbi:hypothetical protein C8J56DRAFT_1067027 [Mycena floridula]|nr:hypothetical protein C8J56DRAFT_1067027 [Mycena floridula]
MSSNMHLGRCLEVDERQCALLVQFCQTLRILIVYMYFLTMARYPEIQEKVEAEMDPVVGRNFEDRA